MGMKGVYTTPATIVLGNLVRLQEMSLVPWVTALPTPDHRAVTRWAQRIWAILRLTTLNILWTLRNQARIDPQGYTPQHRVQVLLKFWGQLRLLAVAHRYPPRELAVPGAQQHAFSVHCWDAIIPVILERLRI